MPEVVSKAKHLNICQIQAGEHHSVVLTVEGKVFSFGRGDSGQLGRKAPDNSKGQVQEGYFDACLDVSLARCEDAPSSKSVAEVTTL